MNKTTSKVLDKMIDDATADLAALRADKDVLLQAHVLDGEQIQQLKKQLAALRSENERLNQIINARTDDIVERAAENARLREALEAIDGMLDSPFPLSRNEETIRSIARAALAPAAKEQ